MKKIIANEARKRIMYAVDYRSMHTAIHGLFYGKDRRQVEKFAKRLEAISNDTETSPEEMQFVWDDLMSEFPDIQQIEEVNFRDFVDLPGGYKGLEDDDTIYRIVNRVALDLYMESTKKPVEESTADNDEEPRIYVGTYAKYNNGSLDGKWVDLMQFDTYDEFVDYCKALHKDEKDPEFMIQDFENYPKAWYHEAGLPTEEEFDKITDFYMLSGDRKAAYEAYVNHTGDDDFEHFEEAYQGKFNSAEDFAYDLVEGIGWDGVGKENLDMYFDYDAFGRDLMFDFHIGDEDNEDAEGNPEDPDKYYDNEGYEMGEYESDQQVAEDYIDNLGGVSQLGTETAQRYFDYDAFGRDLLINDYFEEDGYYFSRYY